MSENNNDIHKMVSDERRRLMNVTVPKELHTLMNESVDIPYIESSVLEMRENIEGQCNDRGINLVSPVPGDQWFRIIINDSEQIWVLLFPHPSIMVYSIKAYKLGMSSWEENTKIDERRVCDLSDVIEAIKAIKSLLENVE